MEHTAELIWGLLVLCIDFSNSNADFFDSGKENFIL